MADTHSPPNSNSSPEQQRNQPTQSSGDDSPLVSLDRLGAPGAKFLLAFLAVAFTGGILLEATGLNAQGTDYAEIAIGVVAAVIGVLLVVVILIDSIRTYRQSGYNDQSTISDFDSQSDDPDR